VTAGGSTTRTLYVGAYEEQLGSGSINYYSFAGKGVGLRRIGWPSGNGPLLSFLTKGSNAQYN